MVEQGNPGRQQYIARINKQLASLAYDTKISSTGNRNDTAVVSEHTICGLLNLMRDWNLTNANTPGHPNFPGVDLVDEQAQVAVQVTGENSLKKVNSMLEQFNKNKLNRKFKHLIMLVLTMEHPTKDMQEKDDGCFYGRDDIWNIPRLMRQIEQEKDVDKLREIAVYLDKELGFLSMAYQEPVNPAEKNTQQTVKNDESRVWTRNIYILLLAMVLVLVVVRNWPIELFDTSGATIPEEIAKYELVLNGNKIKLPVTFDEMESYGWRCSDESILENLLVMPQSSIATYGVYEEGFDLYDSIVLTNGYGEISVNVWNPDEHALDAKGCIIYEMEIHSDSFNYEGQSYNTLELPLGLELGKSKWYRLSSTGGCSIFEGSENTEYWYWDDYGRSYSFYFDTTSEKLASIRLCDMDHDAMQNMVDSDDYIYSVRYDTEAISEWMGMEMSIDIDNYSIPIYATVSEYLDNGFYLEEEWGYIDAYEAMPIKIRDDTLFNIDMCVFNPLWWELSSDACAIASIDTADLHNGDSEFAFNLKIGEKIMRIPKGMTTEEVVAQMEELRTGFIFEFDDCMQLYIERSESVILVTCVLSSKNRTVEDIIVCTEQSVRTYLDQYQWGAG